MRDRLAMLVPDMCLMKRKRVMNIKHAPIYWRSIFLPVKRLEELGG